MRDRTWTINANLAVLDARGVCRDAKCLGISRQVVKLGTMWRVMSPWFDVVLTVKLGDEASP